MRLPGGKALGAILFALWALAAPARAEMPEIVALGDSLTAGYGLPESDGFVPQLAAWLAANGTPAKVVNAGVSGDTSAGGRARLDWSLTPDSDVLIVNLGGNDLLRGLDPAMTRANLDAILAQAKTRGLKVLLIGLPGPANFGPDWKTQFDAIFPDLAAAHGVAVDPDFMAALRADPAGFQTLMQPDGLHPSAAGVARIVARIGPQVQALLR